MSVIVLSVVFSAITATESEKSQDTPLFLPHGRSECLHVLSLASRLKQTIQEGLHLFLALILGDIVVAVGPVLVFGVLLKEKTSL